MYEREGDKADIACVKCGERFANGNNVDNHMKEHKEEETNGEFQGYKETRICRHFRKGACFKGELCKFVHKRINIARVFTPRCSKGRNCFFLQQNKCSFFHPGVGVQNPQKQTGDNDEYEQYAECRYKGDCWNIKTCPFSHPKMGFRSPQPGNMPPIGGRMRNMWMNY